MPGVEEWKEEETKRRVAGPLRAVGFQHTMEDRHGRFRRYWRCPALLDNREHGEFRAQYFPPEEYSTCYRDERYSVEDYIEQMEEWYGGGRGMTRSSPSISGSTVRSRSGRCCAVSVNVSVAGLHRDMPVRRKSGS